MKKRHLTHDEILANLQVRNAIDAEVRRQNETLTMTDRVVRAIRATHRADILLIINILIDVYHVSPDNVKDIMKLYAELLRQYDDGTVRLNMLEQHIKLYAGVDIEKYADENMDFAQIKGTKGNEIKACIDGARVDDAFAAKDKR